MLPWQSFTQALYDLATHPEYVPEMRKEVESVIAVHGWTKAAMKEMRKVDSFLKESQRMNSTANSGFCTSRLLPSKTEPFPPSTNGP